VHIRVNLATMERFKPATPTRLKVAIHSHFKVASLRRVGVRDEPVTGNARNSNAARRQYPRSGCCARTVALKNLKIQLRLPRTMKDASRVRRGRLLRRTEFSPDPFSVQINTIASSNASQAEVITLVGGMTTAMGMLSDA